MEQAGNTDVTFTMDVPAGDYRIEFFSNTVADPDFPGEGENYIGQVDVTSSGTGLQEFTATLPGTSHNNLALTATELEPATFSGFGSTSEFGTVGQPYLPKTDLQFDTVMQNSNVGLVAGDTVQYTITATNHGPDTFDLATLNSSNFDSDFLFTVLLPPEFAYSAISGPSITCTDLGAGSAGSVAFGTKFSNHTDYSVVTCAHTGGTSLLAAEQSVAYTLSAVVMQSRVTNLTTFTVGATPITDEDSAAYQDALAGSNDITTSTFSQTNNYNQTLYSHQYTTDLVAEKKLLNAENFALGNTLNYQVTIRNEGPDALDLSQVSDPTPGQGTELFYDILPPQLEYSSVSGDDIACFYGGLGSASMFGPVFANHSDYSILSCAYSGSGKTLHAGESLSYVIVATVVDDASPVFYNKILTTVIFGDPEQQTIGEIFNGGGDLLDGARDADVNNYAQAFSQPADVAVTKTLDNPQDVAAGAQLNYTITVTNAGPFSMDPRTLDASGFNPLLTSLFVDLLPPNLTHVSQSNPDLNCTWAGPGSAAIAGTLFNQHSDYSFLLCGYNPDGPITSLASGEVIKTTITTTTASNPDSFTNYVFTGGSPLDQDFIPYARLFSQGADVIDILLARSSNNILGASYIKPVPNNPGNSNGSGQSGSSNLAQTGQTVWIVVPSVTLLVALLAIFYLRKNSKFSTKTTQKSRSHGAARLNVNKRVFVGVAIVMVAAAGWGIFALTRTAQPVAERKIIYDSSEDNTSVEDQLVTIPKDAKSAVCDTVSRTKLEQILKQKTNGPRVSIPTTVTKEGQVSACAFIVDGVQPQGVASVIISTREFKSADAASSAYAILTKVSDKNRKTINNNAFYSTSAKQMVTIKDAKITTITVSLASNAATPDKSFFEQFLDLL